jgi:hypothetical protein
MQEEIVLLNDAENYYDNISLVADEVYDVGTNRL